MLSTQIEIEMERDEIRQKFGGKWQVMLPNSGKLFDTEKEVTDYLKSIGVIPALNTKTIDGNYCQIVC